MSKMSRFEVLDASCCLGAQYVVQRGWGYYIGPDLAFANALAAHLEAVVPRWETVRTDHAIWIYATSNGAQASAAMPIAELSSARFPILAIGKAIEEIDYELYKVIADEFKSR